MGQQQLSTLSFGGDASVLAGYAVATNERCGAVDIQYQNISDISCVVQVRAYDGVTSPSGYYNVGAQSTIVARGNLTVSYNFLSTQIGFFGSGISATVTTPSNATGITGQSHVQSFAQLSVGMVLRNTSDLRGAQWDIIPDPARQGYALPLGVQPATLTKKWGTVNSTTGAINPAGNTVF